MNNVKLNIPINKVWDTMTSYPEKYYTFQPIAERIFDDADKKWWLFAAILEERPLVVEVTLETEADIIECEICVSKESLVETIKQFLEIAETLN